MVPTQRRSSSLGASRPSCHAYLERTGRNRRCNAEARGDRVFRRKQSYLASHFRFPGLHAQHEYVTREGSRRAEMVRDRQITSSRRLRSPRLGKNSPRQTRHRKSAAYGKVKLEIAQQELPLKTQDFIDAVLR